MTLVISNSGSSNQAFLDRVQLLQGDIATQDVDVICTVIPQTMDFKGSLNLSLSAACGRDLDEFILENVYKPKVGEVYALPAFDLPARHIYLGILPNFRTEFDMNETHLSQVTRKMMELARCMLLDSIALPAIATGRRGYAKQKAARVISQAIVERLHDGFEDVRIVCKDKAVYDVFGQRLIAMGWQG